MMNKRFAYMVVAFGAVLALGGCASDEHLPLQGERISVLELQESLRADDVSAIPPMKLQAAWKNEFWPQAGGYPNHAMQHLTLGSDLEEIWSRDIGEAGDDDIPLVAQPIVVNDMVLTIDALSLVRAFDVKTGELLWEQDAALRDEDDRVISGGLAYGDRHIYVTTGYNELLALDYKTGALVWRKPLVGASQTPPTVLDGRVYVVTIDNSLFAFDAKDGSALWDYSSVGAGTAVVGGASPAVNRDSVIAPFSSGEVVSLRVENGSLAWSENLDTLAQFGGLSSIPDIKALPVIDKGLLIVANYSGRMAAMDMRTGRRIWQRDIGSLNMPWVSGDVIFVLSSDNELVALSRKTGLIYWVQALPSYKDMDDHEDPIIWHGPVMAGNRLILVSSYGQVREFDPKTGSDVKEWKVGEGVNVAPIIAGGRLYIMGVDGYLHVYQ